VKPLKATKKDVPPAGKRLKLVTALSAHLPEVKLWSEVAPSRRFGGCREIIEPLLSLALDESRSDIVHRF